MGTEIEKAGKEGTSKVDTPPLDRAGAERVTEEIRGLAVRLEDSVARAWHGKAHIAMGYPNWAAYMRGEFGDKRGDSQLYATAQWAVMRVQLAADALLGSGDSEFSEFCRSLKDSHLSVIEDASPYVKQRALKAALEEKKAGKRITADRLRELREMVEEAARAADRHYVARDVANRLISIAEAAVEVGKEDELALTGLTQLVSLEQRGHSKETGLPESEAEWRGRLAVTLSALDELMHILPRVRAAAVAYTDLLIERANREAEERRIAWGSQAASSVEVVDAEVVDASLVADDLLADL